MPDDSKEKKKAKSKMFEDAVKGMRTSFANLKSGDKEKKKKREPRTQAELLSGKRFDD